MTRHPDAACFNGAGMADKDLAMSVAGCYSHSMLAGGLVEMS